ncbi:hypothetical protein [Streptomyces sp. 351MFTsu5.1]|uniref:hypothetical protein n=1 Tax=Streptomyces sp. 351MFTsu5.1 TaxID=1172180 RepID=UPI00037A7AAD|nr:hypothetical protein [Streptomyces sp. 351MFTsu5.1]
MCSLDAAAFRQALETGPVRAGEDGGQALSVLAAQDDGTVTLHADADGDPGRVAVNRAFLLDAVDALTAGPDDRLARLDD